jgi:hypothetical protein
MFLQAFYSTTTAKRGREKFMLDVATEKKGEGTSWFVLMVWKLAG